MASQKKFLGLGFTFSAQDKGLESKLKAVKENLYGIRDAINQINGDSKSMAKNTSSAAAPKSQSSGSSENKFTQRATETFKKQDGPQDPMKRKFSIDKDASKIEDILGEAKDTLNSDSYAAFKDALDGMKTSFDAAGNATDETKRKIKGILSLFAKEQGLKRLLEIDKALGTIFGKVKYYIKDVGNSFERFFDTLGLRISDIVPEQFKALFGVAKSIFAPILALPKMIFGFTRDRIQKSILKSIEKLRKQQKELINGVSAGSTDSIAEILEGIEKNTSPKKKTIFDSLKGMFSGLLSKLNMFAGLGNLISSLGGLKGLLSLTGLKKVAELVIGNLKNIGKWFGKFARPLFIWGVALSAATGFIRGFASKWDELKGPLSELVNNFMNLGSAIWKFTEPFRNSVVDMFMDSLNWYGSKIMQFAGFLEETFPSLKGLQETLGLIGGFIFDSFKDLFSKLFSYLNPMNILRDIHKGWEMIGSGAADLTKFGLDKINPALKDLTRSIEDQNIKASAVAPISKISNPMVNGNADLLKKQLSSTEQLSELMAENNEYQRNMLNMMKKENGMKTTSQIKPVSAPTRTLDQQMQIDAARGTGGG